jgi:hypothetical protein
MKIIYTFVSIIIRKNLHEKYCIVHIISGGECGGYQNLKENGMYI